MPDPLLHFSVAFAITAPFIGVKRAIFAGIIALLPDFDVLFYIHRSMSHSIIILLIIMIAIISIIKIKKPSYTRTTTLFTFALLTHPILDMFQTYTPILYPLIPYSVMINVNAGIIIDNTLKPYIHTTMQTIPTNFMPFNYLDAPLIMEETFLPALILIAVPLLYLISIKKNEQIIGNNKVLDPDPPINPNGISIEEIEFFNSINPDDVTIVIPTLNEAKAIGKVIEEIKQEGFHNILVVDGYSKDGTPEIAKRMGAKVIYQHGKGKAGAIKTAIENVETPYILVMDGDYTYDPKDIKKMLVHAKKYDEIIGRRMNTENMPFLHRIGNRIINFVFNLLLGTSLTDVCSGMYLLKTEAIRDLEIRSKDFSVEVEIAAYISNYGKITEVPINYRKRIGKEKIRTWKSGYGIIQTIIWLARAYNPVFLIAILATSLLIPGTIITLWELYSRYIFGTWSLGWAWVGLVLIVIGIQGFTITTIILLLKRMEKRLLQKIENRK